MQCERCWAGLLWAHWKERRDESANINFIHVDQSLGCTEPVKGLHPIHHQLERLYSAFPQRIVEPSLLWTVL